MNISNELIQKYLNCCELQKGLNKKTIKAYKIDLMQFYEFAQKQFNSTDKEIICNFIENSHSTYKPRSIKRKIAVLKSFFHFLLCEDIITENPFDKIHTRIKEATILPKIISEKLLIKILNEAYASLTTCVSQYIKKIYSN